MKNYVLCFLVFFVFASKAQSYPKRFQVCSIALNSQDEIQLFRQNLNLDQFEFIELVPSSHNVKNYDGGRWISHICPSPEVHCDILVVSGHFAGMFFGSNNDYILSMSELEQISCQNSCPNIFKNLKEVYLFGCNTLAGKDRSSRTPEEYLRVLVEEHEMARDLAELVVAGRYSVFGPTFKEKMEHIFSPKTRIFGFADLSPLGEQARPYIQNYFFYIKKKYGSYYNYIINDFYKKPNVKKINPYFKNTLGIISSTEQTSGMSSSHPRKKVYNQICSLHSKQISVSSKMQIVKNLLNQGEGFFSFSAIKQFLINNLRSLSFEAIEIFNEIQSMEKVKEKFLTAYSDLNPKLIYIKSQVLHFLNILKWVNKESYHNHLKELLLPLIQNSTRQSFDILNALVAQDGLNPSDILISYDNFPRNYLKNIWSVLIVDTLRFNDNQMQRDLMNYCLRQIEEEIVICYQVLKTLGHLGTKDPEILNKMGDFLNHSDEGIIYYSTYGLAYSSVKNGYIQREIYFNLNHPDPWIRLQSLRALKHLNLITPGSVVENKIKEMLKTEQYPNVIREINSILNENSSQ